VFKATNIPDGWTRKYKLNEIEYRVYDSYDGPNVAPTDAPFILAIET